MSSNKKIKVNPNISWVIETKGILVIDKGNSVNTFMSYPKAAVWSVITKHGINPKSINILSAVTNMSADDTILFVDSCLREWKDQRFLNS